MDVILLQDVEKVGKKGTVAQVADGYARNFLLPRKMAQMATPARVAAVQKAMADRESKERRTADQAAEVRELLGKTVVTIPMAAGTGDRIFGSVTNQDIATAIYDARKLRVDKRKVLLDEPIKTLGTHMVHVEVHETVEPAEVKVIVVAQGEE